MASLDDLLLAIEETNNLLRRILEDGISGPSRSSGQGGRGAKATLSKEDKEAVDDEIDLDAWFDYFGDKPMPAKYMKFAGTGVPFDKRELDYLHDRLKEIASMKPVNRDNTHIFTFLGKTYCPDEGNTYNCFGFVAK